MKPSITALGTAIPAHRITTDEALQFLQQQMTLSEEWQRKIRILYRQTRIQTRYSVLPDFGAGGDFFSSEAMPSTAERMRVYQAEALPLAQRAIAAALPEADLSTITHLITVSCTGMYAPGLDIDLIYQSKLPKQVSRTAINFMGCYAAFNALKVARSICQSEARARVLVVGVELCSLHFQPSLAEDQLVSNALFGDGAAAVLIENSERALLDLLDFYNDLEPAGRDDMGWYIRDYGFEMVLKASIPRHLQAGIGALTNKLLERWQLTPEQVPLWAIHPGGRKILEAIETALALSPEQNLWAHRVLAQYGNMSSVTIFFVLQQILQSTPPAGSPVVGMAFGPGLTIEAGLWRIGAATPAINQK